MPATFSFISRSPRLSGLAFLLTAFLFTLPLVGCKKNSTTDPPADKGPDSTAVAGWTLVWHDEFDSSSIDRGKWNFEVNGNGGGNNELQYYTDRSLNAWQEQGWLVIQALKESYLGKSYTSARMTTARKGDWLYGRVDVKAKLPRGRGLWPAIWMMPTDSYYGGWPKSGEIDIMELLGQEPAKVYGTIHWEENGAHLSSGASYSLASGRTFADDFHLFSFEWSADSLKWFVDRTPFHAEHNGPPFDNRFFLILNVAVGGNWPGSPDASTVFPQVMIVDYVRVYSK